MWHRAILRDQIIVLERGHTIHASLEAAIHAEFNRNGSSDVSMARCVGPIAANLGRLDIWIIDFINS